MDKSDRTDILIKRSTDKGATWTEKNITELPTSSKLSYMDPTVVVDKVTGKIFLFTSLWDAVGKPNEKKVLITELSCSHQKTTELHGQKETLQTM